MNQYTSITDYYDLLMTQGYYDYEGMAQAVHSLMNNSQKILELGVGTGLFAEKLLKIVPECQFTGVDFTASFLDIARKRLGESVKLLEADVVKMDLQNTFDIAVSSGGVWVIIQREDKTDLGTHLTDIHQDIEGLNNVAKHLCPNGLLLLSIQGEHKNFEQNLPSGIIYSQSIKKLAENDDTYSLEKSYFFKKNGEILAEQTLELHYFKQSKKEALLEQAGFTFIGIHESQKFHIYQKCS